MNDECLICGAPLEYLETDEWMECAVCHRKERSKTRCIRGHYVCNACHTAGMDSILGLCLAETSNDPIALLAAVGNQMRRLYAAKCAQAEHLGTADLMELCGVRYDFIARKLQQSARGYSMRRLERAVELCAETDYAMKRSGTDNAALLKELLLRLLAEAEA
jgi:hypothetical protein